MAQCSEKISSPSIASPEPTGKPVPSGLISPFQAATSFCVAPRPNPNFPSLGPTAEAEAAAIILKSKSNSAATTSAPSGICVIKRSAKLLAINKTPKTHVPKAMNKSRDFDIFGLSI